MILYPAIDLKDGQCVRLLQGRMEDATVYGDNPAAQASAFAAAGFEWLHVVDLNGAVDGGSRNEGAVLSILKATPCPVQLGGGIRTMAGIERWLDLGVTRVILGTVAARDPGLVKEAARQFPGRVAVGIDARDGFVAVEGWLTTTDVRAVDLARLFEDAGIAALIVTDIARDGTGSGVNVAFTGEIADAVTVPVIASGGIAGTNDIAALKAYPGRPISGTIIGRALYDGSLEPRAALEAARS